MSGQIVIVNGTSGSGKSESITVTLATVSCSPLTTIV